MTMQSFLSPLQQCKPTCHEPGKQVLRPYYLTGSILIILLVFQYLFGMILEINEVEGPPWKGHFLHPD
jgi:hypothetical protein